MFILKFKLVKFLLLIAINDCLAFYGDLFNVHGEPDLGISDTFKSSIDSVKEKWIVQKLDNFNKNDQRVWNMRYLENDEYFKPGGPIFIYIGGEWSISSRSLTTGHMYDMAKEFNGIMFYTEHRFYGKSHPTKDTSTENLKYLTVHQAIADLAHFIEHKKGSIDYLKNAGVIIVGASYSATIATWTKLKYPNLIQGVWASSSPLYAKLDFYEYNEVMTQSVRLVGGEKCLRRIKNAFNQLEKYFAFSEPKVLYKIQKNFNLCEPIKLCRDTAHFFYEISDTIAGLVQKHRDGDIEKACDFITQDIHTDDVEALGAWINSWKNKTCIDMNYDNLVKKFTNITWESEGNEQLRQWIYQTCDAFGWYQTSKSMNQGFSSKHPQIGYFIKMCQDFYGNRFNEISVGQNVQRTNNEFGGFKPQVKNVYTTHGYLDPWKVMGAQQDLHASSPTTVIKGYSHCADLGSISHRDTPEMRASKNRLRDLVKGWLNFK